MRMALLFNPATAVPLQFFMPSIQAAASSLVIQISNAPVHAKDEIEGVLPHKRAIRGGGLIAMPDSFNLVNREPIIALAARYGVRRSITIAFLRNQAASSPMVLIMSNSFARCQSTSTASSRARSLPTSRSSQSLNLSSISKLQRLLAGCSDVNASCSLTKGESNCTLLLARSRHPDRAANVRFRG